MKFAAMIDDRTLLSTPPAAPEAYAVPDDTGPARGQDTAQSTLLSPIAPQPRDEQSPSEPRTLLPRIEGYDVQSLLGRGGMGVVYKARHVELNRPVAIKMLRAAEDAGPDQRLRFSLEAETVARLQHANIVQLFHTGEHGGLPYLVMEYVGGGTLAERLASRPQPIAETARLVESIARAVHVAHCHGIVHRDIKPANILLSADGTPKVADFGLARHLDREGQTQTGMIAGTVNYMAPEQAWGGSRLGEVGPAADVYALGVILYEALTGRPPFKSDSVQKTLEMVWNKEPPSLHSLRSDVPRDLETICLRCLHKDPARRYATAEHLAEDLRRYREHRPIQARPIGRLERLRLWCRRNPAAALFAAAAIVVFLLGAAGVTVKGLEAIENARQADKQRKLAEGEKRVAEKERDEALDNLYAFLTVSADRALADNDLHLAADCLDKCPPKLRNVEWNLLDRRLRGSRLTLAGSLGPVTSAVYSPDEKTIATSSLRGPVRLWDANSGKLLGELAVPAEAVVFTSSGDRLVLLTARSNAMLDHATHGSWSVAWHPGRVEVWDVDSRNRVHSFEAAAISFALSGDDKFLAIGVEAKPPHVEMFDFASGERLHKFALEGNEAEAWFWDAVELKFSPDGSRLLAVGLPADPEGPQGVKRAPAQMQLTLWDVASRERKLQIRYGENANVLGVFGYGGSAFSPQGNYLVVHNAFDDAQLGLRDSKTVPFPPLVFDLSTGEHTEMKAFDVGLERRIPLQTFEPGTPAWEADKAAPLWWGGRHQHGSMAWSKDGSRIAFSKGVSLRVFDAATGQLIADLSGHRDHIPALAFKSDATELLSAGGVDLVAKAWSADEPAGLPWRLNLEIPHQDSMTIVRQAAFSPDCQTLAVGDKNGEIQLYGVATRKLRRTIPPLKLELEAVLQAADKFRPILAIEASHLCFTGPEELLVVYDDRIVARYDLSGKTPQRVDLWDMSPLFERGWASMTAIDPRGEYFLAVSNPEGDPRSENPHVIVVNLRTREPVVKHVERGVNYASRGLVFSQQGRRAHFQGRSVTGEPIHRAWELPAGEAVAPGDRAVFAEDTFSRDGSRRVAANDRGIVQIVDTASNRALLALTTPDDWCEWAIFSADGRWLLLAGKDGLSLFDVRRLAGAP